LNCDIMIGVIGTAPEGTGVPTITPGAHGGNMDCRRIGTGTTLYLPVNAPGALLSMGDLHGLMGDGEMMICGLETAGKVKVRVTVLKENILEESGACFLKEALPLLDASGTLMTIQSAETLDEAAQLAACRMQQLVAKASGLDDVNSGMLMSLTGNLIICQIVNPLKTVRCEFPKDILERCGAKLP
ncbi:MAG: acetamidase/formamidase family protein, partial [Enterocloster sp.]